MKFKYPILYLFSLLFFSCQNDNQERLVVQKKEAQKKEIIFNNINNGWIFNLLPIDPLTASKINRWIEWRNFLTEINQKPKSSIGAFQKKAVILSKKAFELNNNMPPEFSKPQIKARINVLVTKIKTMDLFIHLNQIPDAKIIKLITEINTEIQYLQLQMEEIVNRSLIPKEEGEPDFIKMKDTTRAVPTKVIQK